MRDQKAENVTAAFFVNGSGSEWAAKTVGVLGGSKMFSRRFDIEFRTQYVYSYDATENVYTKHAISVPMFFVQEEYYDALVSDVRATNGVTISVQISSADFNKVTDDYDTLIPIFVEGKDLVTPDIIINYIGNKITFESENN